MTLAYLKSSWFSMQMFLYPCNNFLKSLMLSLILGYLSTSLTIFILSMIVPLVILSCSSRLLNCLFSLIFSKTSPCWYVKISCSFCFYFNYIFVLSYNIHCFFIAFHYICSLIQIFCVGIFIINKWILLIVF